MATETNPDPLELLSAGTAAKLFDCSEIYIRKLMQSGRLPVVVLGERAKRVRRRDLEKFLNKVLVPAKE